MSNTPPFGLKFFAGEHAAVGTGIGHFVATSLDLPGLDRRDGPALLECAACPSVAASSRRPACRHRFVEPRWMSVHSDSGPERWFIALIAAILVVAVGFTVASILPLPACAALAA